MTEGKGAPRTGHVGARGGPCVCVCVYGGHVGARVGAVGTVGTCGHCGHRVGSVARGGGAPRGDTIRA